MRRTLAVSLFSSFVFAAGAYAAVSATVVSGSFTQGTVQASLGTGTTYANSTNSLGDWWQATSNLATAGTKFAISMTNANFHSSLNNNATMFAFGNGGGVTLKFDQAVKPVAGQKEFGLFTAQMLVASSGALFNGNMEASILVSDDGNNWVTLSGASVANPLTYTATSNTLNAPSMGFNFGNSATAWSDGSPGTDVTNLQALTAADYTTPMPDDNLFNGTGTNADRLALKNDSSAADYAAIFGTSGGGNWFDISNTGLTEVNYVRLNGVNTGGGIRLDGVFANAAAVPEPAMFALAGVAGLLALRRRRKAGAALAVLTCAIASTLPASDAQAQSLDSITNWTGTGTNRAAMVIYWRSPEVLNNTSVPSPNEEKTMIWGFRFNGTSLKAVDMFDAIVAADPKLFAVEDNSFGKSVLGLGYDDGDGQYGLKNVSNNTTVTQADFTGHQIASSYSTIDSQVPTDTGDLYWGGGFGPGWDLWTEHGDAGGFLSAPNRGLAPYFTSDGNFGGTHGEWDLASSGISDLPLNNGSWIGFSVAAGGLVYGDDTNPGTIAYDTHKAAPPTVPEPAMLASFGLIAAAGLRRVRR